MPGLLWLPALCGVAVGAAVGWGIRRLLAVLRRGAVLRPGVAEATCALVTGVGVGLAWGGPLIGLVVWAGWLGVALGAVDIRHHRLPDALTLPAIPITMLVVAVTEWRRPEAGNGITALVVAAVLSGLFLLLATVAPSGMGQGDVKLVPSLALMTGYVSVAAAVLGVVVAFVLGAAWAVVGLASRRMTMKTAIPFGPFLLAGCWLVLLFPEAVTGLVR
ncbi:MAG TPA: A24 family peptidase [Nakamurella sp.]|nr:A24 family peptidase [Nakamurella sp.]